MKGSLLRLRLAPKPLVIASFRLLDTATLLRHAQLARARCSTTPLARLALPAGSAGCKQLRTPDCSFRHRAEAAKPAQPAAAAAGARAVATQHSLAGTHGGAPR